MIPSSTDVADMTDSSDGEGWLEISGYLVLFAGVIYLCERRESH